MQGLKDMEIGVLIWANPDPSAKIAQLNSFGVRCTQVGLRGDLDLSCVDAWNRALQSANLTATSVCASYNGEDYADIPTVKRTVGFIPPATRTEREARTIAACDFAHTIGAKSVTTHIGFVPEDTADPDYVTVREMVRRVCDHAAKHAVNFSLETGQETAPVLLAFIRDVGRSNLGINFDPANMILYGTGDPIEALGILGKHVQSVHCKDGNWPPKVPGALGKEQPLGSGAVGIERFLAKLREIGYTGPLTIEREGVEPVEWAKDVTVAIQLLEGLKARAAQA
jgi:L-ribulose-5-phosphate 3-epimerase